MSTVSSKDRFFLLLPFLIEFAMDGDAAFSAWSFLSTDERQANQ
jgi:hypothetical protein